MAEGGHGLDHRGQAVVFEEAGYSLLGPQALNCAAPDEGNMHLLRLVATPEQRERYLGPAGARRARSCFAMTEPAPGAGSDPSMLRTTARRDGDDWVLDGHKWFITGADGAAFAICMARTGERIERDEGATMFLVDAGTPGLDVRRVVGSHRPRLPRRARRGRLRTTAACPRTPCSARSGSATATRRCGWRRRGSRTACAGSGWRAARSTSRSTGRASARPSASGWRSSGWCRR